MTQGLVDTSAFVSAIECEIDLAALPVESTISVMTVCELNHGVLAASDAERPTRLRTLSIAQHEFDALPIDHLVAARFGELMWHVRRKRKARPDAADAVIAATALAHGLPVVTRDNDFKVFEGIEVVYV